MTPTLNDEVPWIDVAKEVLDNKHHGANRDTMKSMIIGMRGIRHPLTVKATEKLINQLKKK